MFDPVKKKTRAGGGRSQPGEDRSTTGPIRRGTEALVLRETVCSRQRADREEVRSTTGPIGRGTEVLVLRDGLRQRVDRVTVCSRQRRDRETVLPWKTGDRKTAGRTKRVVRLRQQKTAVNIRVRSLVLSWLRRREESGVAAEWEAAIVFLSYFLLR